MEEEKLLSAGRANTEVLRERDARRRYAPPLAATCPFHLRDNLPTISTARLTPPFSKTLGAKLPQRHLVNESCAIVSSQLAAIKGIRRKKGRRRDWVEKLKFFGRAEGWENLQQRAQNRSELKASIKHAGVLYYTAPKKLRSLFTIIQAWLHIVIHSRPASINTLSTKLRHSAAILYSLPPHPTPSCAHIH